MKIHQIYTHSELRNYNYIIELSNKQAIVIDPWQSDEIKQFLTTNGLSLRTIINTHEHWDHIQGNEALVESYQCEVWAHKNGKGKIPGLSRILDAGEKLDLGDDYCLEVLNTPGHTLAHLCFLLKKGNKPEAVFTGDTLFNAGIGHCRDGNIDLFYQTISEQIAVLDDDVVVYPGHDYLENNLKFTLSLEADNQVAKDYLGQVLQPSYKPGCIKTTIAIEKQINTFLRLQQMDVIKSLKLNSPTAKQTFVALRAQRDCW